MFYTVGSVGYFKAKMGIKFFKEPNLYHPRNLHYGMVN